MINEYLIGKDIEGSGRGLFWGTVPKIVCRDREKTREISVKEIRSPRRDLNPGPSESIAP